jgi:hypothetical protein
LIQGLRNQVPGVRGQGVRDQGTGLRGWRQKLGNRKEEIGKRQDEGRGKKVRMLEAKIKKEKRGVRITVNSK